jgi:hypothetical protein
MLTFSLPRFSGVWPAFSVASWIAPRFFVSPSISKTRTLLARSSESIGLDPAIHSRALCFSTCGEIEKPSARLRGARRYEGGDRCQSEKSHVPP